MYRLWNNYTVISLLLVGGRCTASSVLCLIHNQSRITMCTVLCTFVRLVNAHETWGTISKLEFQRQRRREDCDRGHVVLGTWMVQWWQTDRKCKQIAEPLARMASLKGEGGKCFADYVTGYNNKSRKVIVQRGRTIEETSPFMWKPRVYRPFCRLRDSTCIETLPSSRVLCSGFLKREWKGTREKL